MNATVTDTFPNHKKHSNVQKLKNYLIALKEDKVSSATKYYNNIMLPRFFSPNLIEINVHLNFFLLLKLIFLC